jgi:hypothetical protein
VRNESLCITHAYVFKCACAVCSHPLLVCALRGSPQLTDRGTGSGG